MRKGKRNTNATLALGKIVVPMMDGIESIVDDGFQKCFERGLLIRTTGDIIALSPPLIVDRGQIDFMVDTIGDVLKTVH